MTRLIIFLALIASASPALAFHEIDSFDRSANTGGGGSSYYTGSPRFKGYDCNICHADAEERISIELGGNLLSGTYEPGLVYRIDVKLLGEHRGLESAFNPNTFTADITDAVGNSIGLLSAGVGNIVEIVDEGRIAVAEGLGNGETEWSFTWVAPEVAVPARLYIALLDGDGANDPVRRFIDPINDDVATLRFDLCPAGGECPPQAEPGKETSPAGCQVSDHPGARGALAFLVVFFLLGHRPRRG
jgi:MYXO-CTERM domain-containing protein